jgi:hypothetical protein
MLKLIVYAILIAVCWPIAPARRGRVARCVHPPSRNAARFLAGQAVNEPNADLIIRRLAASTPAVVLSTIRGKQVHCPLCGAHATRKTSFEHRDDCVYMDALRYVRDQAMRTLYFGEFWDVPALDNGEQVATALL